MNYKQAKEYHDENPRAKIYMARYDGRVWSAGRMVEVGGVIGYYTSKDAADKACLEYESVDFDKANLYTSAEVCDEHEFDEERV